MQGAYAEYIAVAATHILRKPDYLSWAQAASIPEVFLTGKYVIFRFRTSSDASAGPTAYQALVLIGKIRKGDDVLIHAGASGVGIAAAQLARYFGA